jgi:GNAT superfamily N-acetyltransferase
MTVLKRLQNSDAEAYSNLIFPAMKDNLSLLDQDTTGKIAIGAISGESPAGLVYGEIDEAGTGHVRCLFVKAAYRKQGIGRKLLAAIEEEFHRAGCGQAQLAYVTGKPSTEALEQALRSQGWDAPSPQVLFCNIDSRMLDWYVYQAPGWLVEGFELEKWIDITEADREKIARTQAEQAWIPEDLVPFQYEENLEPLNSFAIRYHGEVAGWMITHRVRPDTIRYTCSFIREDLQRRFRILPIYQEAYRAQSAAGVMNALFMVPYRHKAMVNFVKRRWANQYGTVWESRECSKKLGASAEVAHGRA